MSTGTTRPFGTQTIEQARWRIDPERSSVEFRSPVFGGLMTVKGRFERFDGTLCLSAKPAIELTIDGASLNTENPRRDKHLRSRDFFDVENHPRVDFISYNATLNGDELKVSGHLRAAGKSLPLKIDASLRRVGKELEVEAETPADHRELGMTWNKLGMIGTPSTLIVHGRLVQDIK
jgi:polyisoprenoid-binding protein YceI